MMRRILLWPLSLIYLAVTLVRNWLYDCGLIRVRRFGRPGICVGNITVGGTGKTPFIDFVASLLHDHRPALVSRGYRRKSKGLQVASASSTAADIGDEPMQMHLRHPSMPVAVSADRAEAIDYLLANTDAGVVLMDDGFQHRRVAAGLNVLVMDYARPMWRDMVFPAGNLREGIGGRNRASVWIVNKCPAAMTDEERRSIARRLKPRDGERLFFSAVEYGDLVPMDAGSASVRPQSVLAVAGIGRPQPFFDEVRRRFAHVETLAFADHHNYTGRDIALIGQRLGSLPAGPAALVVTEKDAMRLRGVHDFDGKSFYLPIRLKILFGEERELEQIITDYVTENK